MKKQAALQRLARVEGQVRGVAKMVEQDRYCIDILNQVMAIRVALSQVEILILQGHADDCVEEAISAGDPEEQRDRKRVGSGKSVSVRVVLGGRHVIKKTNKSTIVTTTTTRKQKYRMYKNITTI